MSIAVMANVWGHSKSKVTDLLLLLAIADYANGDGVAWPSVDTLSRKARLSRRGVQYSIQRLIESGELTIGRNDGPQGCNLYTVHCGAPCTPCTGAQNGTEGVHSGAPEPSVNRQSMSSQARARTREEDGDKNFETAWQCYPKRAGGNSKIKAFKAWKARIAQGYEPEEIIQGVGRYRTYVETEGLIGTSMVKQAATFFGPDLHFTEEYAMPIKPKRKDSNGFYEAINKTRNQPLGDFINGTSTRLD